MIQTKIYDDYANQIVHLLVEGRVYHAAVAGDGMSAVCLETQQRVTGRTRQECLPALAETLQKSHRSLVYIQPKKGMHEP